MTYIVELDIIEKNQRGLRQFIKPTRIKETVYADEATSGQEAARIAMLRYDRSKVRSCELVQVRKLEPGKRGKPVSIRNVIDASLPGSRVVGQAVKPFSGKRIG